MDQCFLNSITRSKIITIHLASPSKGPEAKTTQFLWRTCDLPSAKIKSHRLEALLNFCARSDLLSCCCDVISVTILRKIRHVIMC